MLRLPRKGGRTASSAPWPAPIAARHLLQHIPAKRTSDLGRAAASHLRPMNHHISNTNHISEDANGRADKTSHHRGRGAGRSDGGPRSDEHTTELPSLMRKSYAVFC